MRRASFLIGLVLVLSGSHARAQFQGIHGANNDAYMKWFERAKADGFRPVFVSGCDAGGQSEFTAVAVKDDGKAPWEVRHGLSGDDFQKAFTDLSDKNFRLTCVNCYMDGKHLRYAGVWIKDGSKEKWEARHGLRPAQYQDEVTAFEKRGMRPAQVSVCGDGKGEPTFAAIFVDAGKTPWVARHDIPPDQFQKLFDEQVGKGLRPTSEAVYQTKNGLRMAAVFSKPKDNDQWTARLGLTNEQYQKEYDSNAKAGMRPLLVSPYRDRGEMYYAGVWIDGGPQDLPLAPELSMSGKRVPLLDAFDEAMQTFMRERHIQAGTLAVMKDGKLVLSQGFGHADVDGKRQVDPDDPFRIASVTKPFTAAAVRKLIKEGKVKADTKVFAYLGVTPPPSKEADPRLKDITVQHLLDHKGGWDRDTAFDPMFRSQEIAKSLGKSGPAGSDDVVHYMAGQPLQFDPGSKSVYSNFGYCVLGRVVEKASGKSYVSYLQDSILAPLGVKSIELGHSLVKERDPHEPCYLDPGTGVSVFDSKKEVPAPDGTFYLEAMDSHGGLIASAPDLVRFGAAYWISGEPRKPKDRAEYTFFGSLPGTHSMLWQRADGIVIAALFNQRTDPSRRDYDKIQEMMTKAADGVKKWPQ
jgi:N-acyl-D-amino-acid deacylase